MCYKAIKYFRRQISCVQVLGCLNQVELQGILSKNGEYSFLQCTASGMLMFTQFSWKTAFNFVCLHACLLLVGFQLPLYILKGYCINQVISPLAQKEVNKHITFQSKMRLVKPHTVSLYLKAALPETTTIYYYP